MAMCKNDIWRLRIGYQLSCIIIKPVTQAQEIDLPLTKFILNFNRQPVVSDRPYRIALISDRRCLGVQLEESYIFSLVLFTIRISASSLCIPV